jgi:hypothetical protein
MEMRQVVTGTLAWTGLVVVVAVPSAEALLSRLTHPTTASYEQPADLAVAPTPTAIVPKQAAAPAGPGAVPAVKQAAITRPASGPAPVVAADSPLSMKPQPAVKGPAEALPAVTAEAETSPAAAPKVVAKATTAADTVQPVAVGSLPAASTGDAPSAAPVEESAADLPSVNPRAAEAKTAGGRDNVQVATSEAVGAGLTDGIAAQPAPPPVPMPAADRPKAPPVRVVTADELDGWKSGSLADYLRQRNFANAANSAPDDQN